MPNCNDKISLVFNFDFKALCFLTDLSDLSFVINFLLTATFSVTTDYFCESMIIIFPFKLFMLAFIYYIQFCNVICKNLNTSSWTHSVYISLFILDNQDMLIFKKELSLLKNASWHGILLNNLLFFNICDKNNSNI